MSWRWALFLSFISLDLAPLRLALISFISFQNVLYFYFNFKYFILITFLIIRSLDRGGGDKAEGGSGVGERGRRGQEVGGEGEEDEDPYAWLSRTAPPSPG